MYPKNVGRITNVWRLKVPVWILLAVSITYPLCVKAEDLRIHIFGIQLPVQQGVGFVPPAPIWSVARSATTANASMERVAPSLPRRPTSIFADARRNRLHSDSR